MHCKSCDYPLWNLAPPPPGADRLCPECGAPFKPTDYRFTPNSVRFCCPHCKLAYYGTSAEGLLEPANFNCIQCGESCSTDRMILLPGEGVPEHITRGGILPWQDQAQFKSPLGKVRAWLTTVSLIAFSPTRAGRLLQEAASLRSAAIFALITSAIGCFMSGSWIVVAFQGAGLFRLGIHADVWTVVTTISQILASLVAGPIIILLLLAINALSTTWFARFLGARRATFPLVLEAHLYGLAGAWLMMIPCLSFYTSPIWLIWMIVAISCVLSSRVGLSVPRALRATAALSLIAMIAAGAIIGWMFYTT